MYVCMYVLSVLVIDRRTDDPNETLANSNVPNRPLKIIGTIWTKYSRADDTT